MSRDLDLAAADLLDRAADYIETHGWTRGNFEDHGRVCVIGAMVKVNGEVFPKRAVRLLEATVDNATDWNDAQKSRRPVLRTLREVAAEVRTRATDGAA